MALSTSIARMILALGGATAIAWVVTVFPVFRFENAIDQTAKGIIGGEAFSPDVLTAVEALSETNRSVMRRSSELSKAAVLRLRHAEDEIRSGEPKRAEQEYKSAGRMVHDALRNAPSDPFLWLVLFSLDSNRNGVRPDNLRFLRTSYELGPNEGWIATRRSGIAFAHFAVLPNDLAEKAISDFVGLVRWGMVDQAADIASGPAQALRSILFPRLKGLTDERRRAFAAVIYRRELDDVPVPGIAPPTPQIPLPVLPPDF